MSSIRIDDGGEVSEVPLRGDRIVFGRLPECDVVLSDSGISREHAELVRVGAGWEVHDLDSRNGTFVNDAQVERQRFGTGDVLRLGQIGRAHV